MSNQHNHHRLRGRPVVTAVLSLGDTTTLEGMFNGDLLSTPESGALNGHHARVRERELRGHARDRLLRDGAKQAHKHLIHHTTTTTATSTVSLPRTRSLPSNTPSPASTPTPVPQAVSCDYVRSPDTYNTVATVATLTDNLPHVEVKSVSNEAWTSNWRSTASCSPPSATSPRNTRWPSPRR